MSLDWGQLQVARCPRSRQNIFWRHEQSCLPVAVAEAADSVSSGVEPTPDRTVASTGGDPDSLAAGPSVEDLTETAEQELASLEQQFVSIAGDDVPLAMAEDAYSVASRIYDQSAGIPDLQARAALVQTQAQGYIDGYQLTEIQDEFDSYILAPDGVPSNVAERAGREASAVFERNANRPVLQAHAAYLRAQALAFLEDWSGAVTWAQRAVDLDSEDTVYRQTLELAQANLARNQDA